MFKAKAHFMVHIHVQVQRTSFPLPSGTVLKHVSNCSVYIPSFSFSLFSFSSSLHLHVFSLNKVYRYSDTVSKLRLDMYRIKIRLTDFFCFFSAGPSCALALSI